MRKTFRYTSAAAITGLYAAAAFNAYTARETTEATKIDYRKTIAAAGILTALTWSVAWA